MYPPVTYADSYVQRRDPDRAVKPPPLELSHQDGDHMRRLAVLTANHRCLTATARKAVFLPRVSLLLSTQSQADWRPGLSKADCL